MAIRSFLTLSLALLAQARPRHVFDPEDVGSKITLPVISAPRGVEAVAAPSAGDDEDKPFHILPFPYNGKRTILEDDEGAAGAVTLPVPRPASRRSAEDDDDEEDKPFHILPFNEKRKLPVEDGPIGTITLPVIHAHRPVLDKRAVEVQVENRSDVSYYAQREYLMPIYTYDHPDTNTPLQQSTSELPPRPSTPKSTPAPLSSGSTQTAPTWPPQTAASARPLAPTTLAPPPPPPPPTSPPCSATASAPPTSPTSRTPSR